MKSPIKDMTDEEYRGFVAREQQQAAQDALDMGLIQRTPANSTARQAVPPRGWIGPWFGKAKSSGGKS